MVFWEGGVCPCWWPCDCISHVFHQGSVLDLWPQLLCEEIGPCDGCGWVSQKYTHPVAESARDVKSGPPWEWDSSDGSTGSRPPWWHCRTFLRFNFGGSILNLSFTGIQTCTLALLTPLVLSPFSLTEVPSLYIWSLILSWHLFLRGPRLAQPPITLWSSAGTPLPAVCYGHGSKTTGLKILGQSLSIWLYILYLMFPSGCNGGANME